MLVPVDTRHPPRGTRSTDTRLLRGAGRRSREWEPRRWRRTPFSGLLLMPMLLEAKIKSSYPPRHLSRPMLQGTGLGILSELGTRQVCKPESCQLLSMRITQWWASPSRCQRHTNNTDSTKGETEREKYTRIQRLHLPLLRIGSANVFMLYLLCLCLFPQLHQLVLPFLSRGVDDVLLDTENASLHNS